MLHAKFIGLWVPEKIFKGFGHTWASGPFWSCYHDHFYKIHVPSSKGGSTSNFGQVVSEKNTFENNGHIHVGVVVFFFQKYEYSVN